MAQYLNPDLDGDCVQTTGLCPLRMLEQTCSNVGKDMNSSQPDASRSADLPCPKPVRRDMAPDRASDCSTAKPPPPPVSLKRCCYSPAPVDATEKRARRECSAQQSSAENHLLLTVATAAQQCTTPPNAAPNGPAAPIHRPSATIGGDNCSRTQPQPQPQPQPQMDADSAKWLELQRAMLALHAALQAHTAPPNELHSSVSSQTEQAPSAFTAVHPEGPKQFTCQWMSCGLQFSSVDELSKHLNVHVHAQTRLSNVPHPASSGFNAASLGAGLQAASHHNAVTNTSAGVSLPANIQQLLLSGGLLTPRPSLSSSNMSPVSPLSLTPPPTATSPQSPQAAPLLAYPNWLSFWLSRYVAGTNSSSSSGAHAPAAPHPTSPHSASMATYGQLAASGSVNNVLNGLTSANVNLQRELVGYPVLSPYAGGLPNASALSLLTHRFGSAV